MDEGDGERRITALVHVVFIGSIGVFAVILWFARGSGGAPADPTGRAELRAFALLVIAAAECFGADLLGRRRLARASGDPVGRVRAFFLIRFGAAEAAAIFGLMLGFSGAGAFSVAALFALSLGALALAAPTPRAWSQALALAKPEGRRQ